MRWPHSCLCFLLLLAGCGENTDYLKAERLSCRFTSGKMCRDGTCSSITAPKKVWLALDFAKGEADYMDWFASLQGNDFIGPWEQIADVKTSSENRIFSMQSNYADVEAVLSKDGWLTTTQTGGRSMRAFPAGTVLTFEASCRACPPVKRDERTAYYQGCEQN